MWFKRSRNLHTGTQDADCFVGAVGRRSARQLKHALIWPWWRLKNRPHPLLVPPHYIYGRVRFFWDFSGASQTLAPVGVDGIVAGDESHVYFFADALSVRLFDGSGQAVAERLAFAFKVGRGRECRGRVSIGGQILLWGRHRNRLCPIIQMGITLCGTG